MGMRYSSIVKVAMYTALVFVATIILQIYIPATRGYFNLGEASIYVIALLLTPLSAGIAAGVGSALADVVTGYGIFAPGTLVIKFAEGFMVSYLARILSAKPLSYVKYLSVLTSTFVGMVISIVGIFKLSGIAELSSIPIDLLGFRAILLSGRVVISWHIWVIIGATITLILLYLALVKGRENVSLALSMLTGGLVMVFGYFMYEYFFTNPIIYGAPPEQAFVEVPVNFGQVFVGLSVALPITSFISKAVGGSGSTKYKGSKSKLSVKR